MALPISKVVPTTNNNISRELDEIYKDLHELDFISFEACGQKILEKKESLQKEKQISVDPISLRESVSSSMGEISFNMMLPPINAPQPDSAVPLPPPLLPANQKFLITSPPRFGSILSRKNLKNESQTSPRQVNKLVDDDLWLHDHGSLISNPNVNNGGFRKSSNKMDGNNEVDFKCSALCLFLPGFGKAKPVRPRMAEAMVVMEDNNVISRTVSMEKFECGSWASSTLIQDHDEDGDGDGDSMNLYFHLPLELIKNLGNDADLPVSAAFVFDNKDIKGVLKNGSTPTRTTGRKSHESAGRHVRFSTSDPGSPAACITPRLRKAREDFNAFLEAQSA